jgi:hypothetical protein
MRPDWLFWFEMPALFPLANAIVWFLMAMGWP